MQHKLTTALLGRALTRIGVYLDLPETSLESVQYSYAQAAGYQATMPGEAGSGLFQLVLTAKKLPAVLDVPEAAILTLKIVPTQGEPLETQMQVTTRDLAEQPFYLRELASFVTDNKTVWEAK